MSALHWNHDESAKMSVIKITRMLKNRLIFAQNNVSEVNAMLLTNENVTLLEHLMYLLDLATLTYTFLWIVSSVLNTIFSPPAEVKAKTRELFSSLQNTIYRIVLNCHTIIYSLQENYLKVLIVRFPDMINCYIISLLFLYWILYIMELQQFKGSKNTHTTFN